MGFQDNVLAGINRGFGSLLTLRCIYGTQFVLNSKFWGKFCRPFKFGGLGVPNLQEMNLALLSKLLWKLVPSPDSVGSRILHGK